MCNHCPRLVTHETITVQDQEMQCAYVATVHNKSTRVNGHKFKPGKPGGYFGGTGFRVGKELVEPRALS